ncbi:cytochrome c oxidase subunit I [soil metagenome]
MTPDPVSFTVHSMPAPGLESDRRTRSGRLKMLLVLLICAAPVIASYFTYFVVRPDARTNYSELIIPQRTVPADLVFTTLQGKAVPAESLKGQWLLIVVGNGGCDAGCEKHLVLQRQLYETLGREKLRADKVWLVPDDQVVRPEVIRGITVEKGEQPLVLRAPAQALSAWLAPESGRALSDHIYVVDPHGNWMMRTPVDPDPKRLKSDIEKVLRASASWDEPGR